jgi:hypothetical protein
LAAEPQVGHASRVALDGEAADLAGLKAVLERHGFLGPAVREALGSEIGPAHLRTDLPLYLRRLAAPKPLHTIIKLFSLRQWLGAEEVAAAVAPVLAPVPSWHSSC